MSEPLIDILMATYNGERFVAEQIESIQCQSYENWRLLVSDDCSTDGTLDVVRHYAASDNRIRIVSEGVKRGGAKENFFALMGFSDAPYCMFCDQDDVWLPEKIEKSLAGMRRLEAGSSADSPLLVFCDMKVVDGGLSVIHESFERSSHFDISELTFDRLVSLNVAAGCCQCFNAKLRDTCLDCEDVGSVEMHDWWTVLIAAAFGTIGYIDQPLSLYRQHGGNVVGANEYAPVARARHFDFMVSEFKRSATQAACFKRTYFSRLDDSTIKKLGRFESMQTEPSLLKNLSNLFTSKFYKRGFRILGSIAVVARVSSSNKRLK